MRVALYTRVSSSDQTTAPQINALDAYTEARGLSVVEVYEDAGVSGAKDRRPALDRLFADARRRRFDVLVVTKLDRLARSVRHLTALAAELEALGVDLVVLDQAIDTTTPSGRLLFHTLAAVAEFERDLIRERTRAGVDAARRRGKQLGRPRAVRGAAKYELERLVRQRKSLRAMAAELGCAPATVAREIARLGIVRA